MILEKMRSCLWKLEPGFWTYGSIHVLGPSGPNVVSRPQVPKSIDFLRFHNFIGFCLMIFEKMRSCLGKLEPGFWANGWIRLLGLSGPNAVSEPPGPKVKTFFEIS